jgi:hypothetical protein
MKTTKKIELLFFIKSATNASYHNLHLIDSSKRATGRFVESENERVAWDGIGTGVQIVLLSKLILLYCFHDLITNYFYGTRMTS